MNENEKKAKRKKIFDERILKLSSTRKLKNYIDNTISSPEFNERVLKIRKRYKIPKTGVRPDDLSNFLNEKNFFKYSHDLHELIQDFGFGNRYMEVIEMYVLFNKKMPLKLSENVPSLISVVEVDALFELCKGNAKKNSRILKI